MTDLKIQSISSAPWRELPPWTDNGPLIERHPELHHYTTREGIAGIWKTNTLWATHFSHLSDSSEIVLLRNPLVAALEAPIKRQIMRKQHESFRTRRFVEKQGGVDTVTKSLARDFVNHSSRLRSPAGSVPPLRNLLSVHFVALPMIINMNRLMACSASGGDMVAKEMGVSLSFLTHRGLIIFSYKSSRAHSLG